MHKKSDRKLSKCKGKKNHQSDWVYQGGSASKAKLTLLGAASCREPKRGREGRKGKTRSGYDASEADDSSRRH